MNVVDVPQRMKREDYDEAIARYVQLVQSRSIAIYRVGNIRFPGLSDIDLLVVSDRCSLDNRFFYSALQRMPRRLLPLFLHDPFILPAWSLRVMRHTTHGSPELLAGRSVLGGYAPSNEPEERWCRLLEGYCASASFVQRTRQSGTLRGRMTVAVASAFRFQLAEVREVLGYDERGYAARIDDLRGGFFDRANPEDGVRDAWTMFGAEFERLDASLRSHLQLDAQDDLPARARALLRGDRESGFFDREYAFRRAQAVDGYHQDLASMGFPYGHLFFIAAHPGAVHTHADSLVNGVVRNLYRVRRRLEEYAAAR